MPEKQTISIASDHAGFQLKRKIADHLKSNDCQLIDRGPSNEELVDYPDYAKKVVSDISKKNADMGILICGSGQGMAMAANKFSGIRAALCYSPEIAQIAREHNDANILTLGSRFIDTATAINCIEKFLNTSFEGNRHLNRINKIG